MNEEFEKWWRESGWGSTDAESIAEQAWQAAYAQARADETMLSIDSVPVDGSQVLVWSERGGYRVASYPNGVRYSDATHWYPLPPNRTDASQRSADIERAAKVLAGAIWRLDQYDSLGQYIGDGDEERQCEYFRDVAMEAVGEIRKLTTSTITPPVC